jgi:hypothetical protein
MKKPKVPQRLNVEVILYKFYTISCFDANTGLPIFFSGNFIPDEEDDSKEYRYEEENGTDFDRFDLGSHFDVLQKVYLENKDKFQRIEFRRDCVDYDYSHYPRIVGIRQETDQEYQDRLDFDSKKQERKAAEKEKKLKEKAEKKIAKEKELLKQLSEKYQNV